jgi:hypothetical protein
MILDSATVENISIKPYGSNGLSLVEFDTFSDDAFILISTFSKFGVEDIPEIAKCITERYGYSDNDTGFHFPNDLIGTGEMIDDIQVFNPMGEVFLKEEDFIAFAKKFLSNAFKFVEVNYPEKLRKQEWKQLYLQFN